MSHAQPPEQDTLQHWQALTRAANAVFAQGRLDQAIATYQRALHAAERLLLEQVPADTAVAAYAVSQLNLAEAHDRAGQIEQAACQLIEVHLRLSRMARDPNLAHDWHHAAMAHGQRSHLELQHFFRTHAHPGIAWLLQASTPTACTLN